MTWSTRVLTHTRAVTIVGLMFAGVIPLGRREVRLTRLPSVGLAGAAGSGVRFGLDAPYRPDLGCGVHVGVERGSAARGGPLAFVYALGLGLPFVAAGLAFTKLTLTVSLARLHQLVLLRVGGAMMAVVGLLLVIGGVGRPHRRPATVDLTVHHPT